MVAEDPRWTGEVLPTSHESMKAQDLGTFWLVLLYDRMQNAESKDTE